MDIFKKSKATVLIFTLLILSVILLLTQQLMKSVMVGSVFNRIMIEREQAETLALSGINIAISQLREKNDEPGLAALTVGGGGGVLKGSDRESDLQKAWLSKILSNLNRWQTFQLDDEIDGLSGSIKICIVAEDGKININEAYDFKKHEFKKEYDFLLKGLEIKGKLPAGQIYNNLSDFLKKRERKLDDITEILNAHGLETINLFYNPPKDKLSSKGSQPNSEICLQDLFTIWSRGEKIEPLLLSDSMCAVFDIRRPHSDDKDILKDNFEKVVDNFKRDWGKNWEENWNFLLPIYDKKPKFLKNINKLLSQEFGVSAYSVLSCGMVGKTESRLLAILTKAASGGDKKSQEGKRREEKGAQNQEENSKKTKLNREFKIVRIYWF